LAAPENLKKTFGPLVKAGTKVRPN